jgi:hypothetical protein
MTAPCLQCRKLGGRPAADPYDPREFTAAEWRALRSSTGYAGEWNGRSVILALMLRRTGTVQLPGVPDPVAIEWSILAYRCPWSPTSRVLTELSRLGKAGVDCLATIYADDWRFTGCPGGDIDDPWPCYIFARTDPSLPPRAVE